MGGVVSHNKDYLVIAHGLRQAGGEEPGQEVLGGGVTAHLAHLGGEGAGAVPGQRQGGGQQQQREHGNTLYYPHNTSVMYTPLSAEVHVNSINMSNKQ